MPVTLPKDDGKQGDEENEEIDGGFQPTEEPSIAGQFHEIKLLVQLCSLFHGRDEWLLHLESPYSCCTTEWFSDTAVNGWPSDADHTFDLSRAWKVESLNDSAGKKDGNNGSQSDGRAIDDNNQRAEDWKPIRQDIFNVLRYHKIHLIKIFWESINVQVRSQRIFVMSLNFRHHPYILY